MQQTEVHVRTQQSEPTAKAIPSDEPQPKPFFRPGCIFPNESMGNDVSLSASSPEPTQAMEPQGGSGENRGKILNPPQTKSCKRKTRRGISKRKNKNLGFTIIGTNSNGLSGKVDSLYNTVKHFKPSCITIQETKLRSKKFEIPGYQVFLKNRPGLGGGLLTAVEENLAPVLVSFPDTEILVIQTRVGSVDTRIINGYGPQEDANFQDIYNFWQDMDKEIISAKEQNCKIIIQLDANAKLGKDILPADPNDISGNGKILLEMVERHNLCILNTEEQCKGGITRHRNTVRGLEISVLDYIIVCQEMKISFQEMIIDEDRTRVFN